MSETILVDPVAAAIARAVAKHNCGSTLSENADRARYFVSRIETRDLDPKDYLVVILNVDDPHGGPIAEALMPGHDWQAYRDRGEVPFARGITDRLGIVEVVACFDELAAKKLRLTKSEDILVLVVDHGTCEVYRSRKSSIGRPWDVREPRKVTSFLVLEDPEAPADRPCRRTVKK